jgi:AcrR family transcriptional regulator
MKDISNQTKKLILTTAYELFSTLGYDHTPVSMIIEKAGISKGGFYHHFKAKEDIIDSIARFQVDAVIEIINTVTSQESLSAIDKFNLLLEKVQAFRFENRDQLYKLYEPFLHHGNLVLKDKIEAYTLEKALLPYVTLIEQGISEGSFHTCSAKLAAESILRIAPILRLKMAKLYIDRETNANYFEEIFHVAEYLEEFVTKTLGTNKGSLKIAQLFKSYFEKS